MPALADLPAAFSEEDKADINCLVAISVVIGTASKTDISASDKANLGSIMIYFVGKLKGRHPALSMTEVMTADRYEKLTPQLPAEMQRCAAESTQIGEDLQAAGKKLIAASQ